MAQLFFLALMAFILYFIADIVRKLSSYKFNAPKSSKSGGDVIDISEAWIDLNHLPYISKSHILPDKELMLYEILNDVINKQTAAVVPKTRLAEILDLTPSASHRAEYARRLRERYADFLICRRKDMTPLILIVSESRGESEDHQQNRDFVKRAAETVSLPLLTLNLDHLPDRLSLVNLLQKAGISSDIFKDL